VQWVGPKPHDDLAAYLGSIEVGLVPYTKTPFNLASSPLKTVEYLAAGCGVVSTDLPATRRLGTDLVEVADGPDRFAVAVLRLLEAGRAPDLVASRQAFARGHSWTARARELVDLLGCAS
jgi:teichuronic acid biosynthesis glycosyltransferase TuaH